jgi:hypothetical protein
MDQMQQIKEIKSKRLKLEKELRLLQKAIAALDKEIDRVKILKVKKSLGKS